MNSNPTAKENHWQLITLTVARETEETASALLFDAGTTGIITLEEREERVKLGAYFDAAADAEQIARDIEAAFAQAGCRSSLGAIGITTVADQDWMQKWKEGFAPIALGERLMIAPSWKLPDATERIVIEIDPGMAFGTGTHETTKLCLAAIQKYYEGGSFLDVGTGTGILAIAVAACAPGAHVNACDTDAAAIAIARENAIANGVADRVTFRVGSVDETTSSADFICANLTAEAIAKILPALVALSCGRLVLSGNLETQTQAVLDQLSELAITNAEITRDGEWAAIIV